MSSKPTAPSLKRLLFWVATLLIPILLLLVAEAFLRVIDYGGTAPLFRQEVRFGIPKWVVNANVAQRYFNLPPEMMPEASSDVAFPVNKLPGTVRIFCLGGSTTAGFPFEINANFPFQLQHRLKKAYPNNVIEIVNLGISAVNSFTVLDLLPEILEKQPDGLIIYMGHNEFYGAFGVGSTQSVGSNRTLILTYLAFKKWQIFQLLENVIGQFSNRQKPGETGESLMQAMAARQEIPLDDPAVAQARDNFSANLQEIARAAKAANVPVVLSTLVSNLRDHSPFISKFAEKQDETTRNRLNAQLLEVRGLVAAGQLEKAASLLNAIAAVDSVSAEWHFLRGEIALRSGETDAAFGAFSRARDLDLLRFRAPSFFNDAIRTIAETEQLPLVDLAAVFRAVSPDGIPGNNLFLEHLHPNFNGYQLMAQSFAIALRQLNFPRLTPQPPAVDLFGKKDIADILQSFRADSAGVTPLDIEFGNLRNFQLMQRWPFSITPLSVDAYQPVGDSLTKATAVRHLRRETYWDFAHYELAEAYQSAGKTARALREIRAVGVAFPENYVPDMKTGDLLLLQNDLENARIAYEKSLSKSPSNPAIIIKLSNTLVLQTRFQEAIERLNRAYAATNLENSQKVTMLYLLGLSHANLRNFQLAERALNEALAIQSDFAPALNLLQQIRDFQR